MTWYSPSWLATTVSVVLRNLGHPVGLVHRDEAGPNVRLVGKIVAVSPVVGKLVPFCTTRLKVTVPTNPSRAATVIAVVAPGGPTTIGPILAGVAVRLKSGT